MSKLKAIQKAYGDYYEELKLRIDQETGCMECIKGNSYDHRIINALQLIRQDYLPNRFQETTWFRPASLENLENNNGWEQEYPKKSGVYAIWLNGKENEAYYVKTICTWIAGKKIVHPTHWRPKHNFPSPYF